MVVVVSSLPADSCLPDAARNSCLPPLPLLASAKVAQLRRPFHAVTSRRVQPRASQCASLAAPLPRFPLPLSLSAAPVESSRDLGAAFASPAFAWLRAPPRRLSLLPCRAFEKTKTHSLFIAVSPQHHPRVDREAELFNSLSRAIRIFCWSVETRSPLSGGAAHQQPLLAG